MINVTIESGFATDISNNAANAFQLNVFPNPATDNTFIQYDSNSNEKIWLAITDIQGRIINRVELANACIVTQTYELNTSHYAPGMYFVELYSGKNKEIRKLVITK